MYYNASEVETILHNLQRDFRDLATVIPLNEPSGDGKNIFALHLHCPNTPLNGRDTVVMIGCVHGNEWGSCDILVDFATALLRAYDATEGRQFGRKIFTAQDISSILDRMDIVVLPLVNPDGHDRSLFDVNERSWRVNSRGVDLNRNFDVLFKPESFAQSVALSVSENVNDSLYQGPHAFSEPECRNVQWLLDQFSRTRWFVDLHSAGSSIKYVWGMDEVQQHSPAISFTDPARLGHWGIPGDDHKEFVAADDLARMRTMAKRFVAELAAVGGTQFTYAQAYSPTDPSVTPGTSHDYAFSRHKSSRNGQPVLGFFVEWGAINPQPFYDPDMKQIIDEVSAGLIGFCLEAM